mgnify:CR=1 FL=1
MAVLSEGIDTDIYQPIPNAGRSDDPFKKQIYDLIKENFVYLHVGQWGKGAVSYTHLTLPTSDLV